MSMMNIDEAPIQCQKLLLHMMRFNPTTEYVSEKDTVVANALSHKPLNLKAENNQLSGEAKAKVDAI